MSKFNFITQEQLISLLRDPKLDETIHEAQVTRYFNLGIQELITKTFAVQPVGAASEECLLRRIWSAIPRLIYTSTWPNGNDAWVHDLLRAAIEQDTALRSQVRALEEKLQLETALPTHLLDVHAIADERDRLQEKVRALEGERDEAREQRDGSRMLLIEERCVETICGACSGLGVRAYGSTATWRGGIGGQTITGGVCDKCWGSGDAIKTWPSHRSYGQLTTDRDSLPAENASLKAEIETAIRERDFYKLQLQAESRTGEI